MRYFSRISSGDRCPDPDVFVMLLSLPTNCAHTYSQGPGVFTNFTERQYGSTAGASESFPVIRLRADCPRFAAGTTPVTVASPKSGMFP